MNCSLSGTGVWNLRSCDKLHRFFFTLPTTVCYLITERIQHDHPLKVSELGKRELVRETTTRAICNHHHASQQGLRCFQGDDQWFWVLSPNVENLFYRFIAFNPNYFHNRLSTTKYYMILGYTTIKRSSWGWILMQCTICYTFQYYVFPTKKLTCTKGSAEWSGMVLVGKKKKL